MGFNATPIFNPADDFWPAIGARITPDFLAALDYVGLDFFPDVFRPLGPDGAAVDLREPVAGVLRHFRKVNLRAGGIPATVPIHIGENGWPTTPTRTYERQAEVLEMIVRTVHQQRTALNITHYEYFSLRDAVTASPDLGFQFGLLRDDYTLKPAFTRYRELIAELG
jgi:hypothetical protein